MMIMSKGTVIRPAFHVCRGIPVLLLGFLIDTF